MSYYPPISEYPKLLTRALELKTRVNNKEKELISYVENHGNEGLWVHEKDMPSFKNEFIQLDLLIKTIDSESPLFTNLGSIMDHYMYSEKDIQPLKEKYLYAIDQIIDHLESLT